MTALKKQALEILQGVPEDKMKLCYTNIKRVEWAL